MRQKISAKGVAIAASLFLLICSAGLLVRGEIIGRIVGFVDEGAGMRAQIYQDTIELLKTVPLAGVGLGNFDAIFPLFRNASLNGQRVIHPESDWLWLASEMGLVSLVFLLIASACCFRWPGNATTARNQDIQLACKIAILIFLINSFFDVPGHRLGTVLPLLLVAGICCGLSLEAAGGFAIPWTSRFVGVGLIGFAFFVLGSDSANSKIQSALAQKDWEQVDELTSTALNCAPMNWSLRVDRGYAKVHQKKWLQAIADFRCALVLEPKLTVVPYEVGRAWTGVSVPMAVSAWRECLRRSREDERSEYYGQILDSSAQDPRFLEPALRLADGDLELCLAALRSGHADLKTMQFLESEKPRLDPDQIRSVLKAEAWQAAIENNYLKAYELGRKAIRHIAFPVRQERSEQECRLALIENPEDLGAGFDLCLILESEKRWPEALRILGDLCHGQNCPDYLKLMKADSLASLTDWPAAWNALSELF
jgi:hypothetical protein